MSKLTLIVLIVTCISVVGVVLSGFTTSQSGPTTESASAYSLHLQRLDQAIESSTARSERRPQSWLAREFVATKYLERARLTGDYDDYAKAERALEQAFELAGEAAGPHMVRARLNYSLHRIPEVNRDLQQAANKIILSDREQASILGLQADVLFHQGHYGDAFDVYQQALVMDRNSTNLFRLGHYYWRTGDFDQAEQYFDEAFTASQGLSAHLDAFFLLHKGLLDLDRGRYREALDHYLAAEAVFSGWWLVQEHIAEIHVLQGNIAMAEEAYRTVIATTGHPEFMDAMAGISASPDSSARWTEQARAAYERQLAQFPEATYGHALSHYLDAGDAPTEALALARANHDLRPYGEAEILLARAYLQNGLVQKAKSVITQTLSSEWSSAELHEVAADIFRAAGEHDRAQHEQANVLRIMGQFVEMNH